MFRITDNGIAEISGYIPDGFLTGYGLYETMRILYEKDRNIIRAENLAEHYRRLSAGKETLGLKGDFSLRKGNHDHPVRFRRGSGPLPQGPR